MIVILDDKHLEAELQSQVLHDPRWDFSFGCHRQIPPKISAVVCSDRPDVLEQVLMLGGYPVSVTRHERADRLVRRVSKLLNRDQH